jgi:hypothetical protein
VGLSQTLGGQNLVGATAGKSQTCNCIYTNNSRKKEESDMKTKWKLQAWRYAWLPLVACVALPAHADVLRYTATSGDASGAWTVNGFDPSNGTLNSVELDVEYSFSVTLKNNSTATENYQISYGVNVTVDQPDGSLLTSRFSHGANRDSLDPGQDITFNTPTGVIPFTFTDLATLAEYTTPDVSLSYSGPTSGIDFANSNLPGNFGLSPVLTANLTVTYDYTPAVSAVPEPTAVVLLGTLVAACLWASRRRLAFRR